MAKTEAKKMDAKGMLKEHGSKGTKIKLRTRKTCEIIAATKFHKIGQIIHPHLVMADQLIKDGIAKEVKK